MLRRLDLARKLEVSGRSRRRIWSESLAVRKNGVGISVRRELSR